MLWRNVVIFLQFHKVGAATGEATVPPFVLTLGTKRRLELNDRSCLCCLAGVSSECKYTGLLGRKCLLDNWY